MDEGREVCDEAEWEGLRPPAASPRRSSCLSDCSRCIFTEGGSSGGGGGGGWGAVVSSLPLRGGGIHCTSASLSCGRLRREAAYLRRLDLYGDIYGASEQLFGFCFLSSRVVPNLLDVKIVLPGCLKG